MTSRIQTQRLAVTNVRPTSGARLSGELWLNIPDYRLGMIDPTKTPVDLLPVRVYAPTASYAAGDIAVNGTQLLQARTLLAPKPFAPTDWDAFQTAAQADGRYLLLTGGTVSGQLNVGTTALSGQTRFEVHPVNPKNGTGAFFMNRQGGGTTGTDDPQVRINTYYNHDGGTQLRAFMLDHVIDGNPGGGSWTNFLRSTYNTNNTATGGHVNTYIQSIRNAVKPGGARGANGWGAIINAVSTTGLPSSQDGILQTLELNLTANGADDYAGIGRTVLTINPGQFDTGGAILEVAYGITFFDEGATFYRNFIGGFSTYSVSGFSMQGATPRNANAHAFWVGDNQHIAFDTAGNWRLAYTSAVSQLKITYAGADIVALDTSGTLNLASGVVRSASNNAISLGSFIGGEVFRINSTASTLTSHMEVIYSSATNTWIIRSAGTNTNAAIDTSGGSAYLRCNGGVCFGATGGSTSVNNLQAAGSIAANPVVLSAVGTGTNLDISLTPKGTGGIRVNGPVGFNSNAPIVKQSVTGSISSGAALTSLLTALAAYGLVVDNTVA